MFLRRLKLNKHINEAFTNFIEKALMFNVKALKFEFSEKLIY